MSVFGSSTAGKSSSFQTAADGSWTRMAYLRSVFDSFDVNGNGTLDASELTAALVKLGCHVKLEELDKNGDGVIDFDEYCMFASVIDKYSHVIFKQPPMSKCVDLGSTDMEQIAKAKQHVNALTSTHRVDDTALFLQFQKLDNDKDQRLTKREMKLILQSAMPNATDFDRGLALFTIFTVADGDRNGYITFDEFKAMMQSM